MTMGLDRYTFSASVTRQYACSVCPVRMQCVCSVFSVTHRGDLEVGDDDGAGPVYIPCFSHATVCLQCVCSAHAVCVQCLLSDAPWRP
jgi:hypothetical protein